MNKYAKLKKLVVGWVLAEYALRREPYLPDIPGGRTDALILAEDALRKAVSGRTDVIDAGLRLGAEPCDVSKPPRLLMKLVAQGRAAKANKASSPVQKRKQEPAKAVRAAKRNKVEQQGSSKKKQRAQRRGFFD